MNKRLKNKIEKRRRQKLCKAFDLCLQINGMQASRQELTGNHPTVFLHFSGQIGSVEVDIHRRGWAPYVPANKSIWVYIDRSDELERLLKQLKNETPGAATPRESK